MWRAGIIFMFLSIWLYLLLGADGGDVIVYMSGMFFIVGMVIMMADLFEEQGFFDWDNEKEKPKPTITVKKR